MAETRNKLTTQQAIELSGWMMENRIYLESMQPDTSTVLKLSSNMLPFQITEANLKHVAKSLKLQWPPTRRGRNEIQGALLTISLELARTIRDLGSKPSQEFLDLMCDLQSKKDQRDD